MKIKCKNVFFLFIFFHSKRVNNVDYRGRNFLGMSLTVYVHDIYIRLHWRSPLQHPSRVCSSKKSQRVSAHTRRTLSRGGRTSKYHGHIIYFLFASSTLIHHHHQLHFFFSFLSFASTLCHELFHLSPSLYLHRLVQ